MSGAGSPPPLLEHASFGYEINRLAQNRKTPSRRAL